MDPNSSFSNDYLPNECKFVFTHSAARNFSYAYSDNEYITLSVFINRIFFHKGLRIEIYDQSLENAVYAAELKWHGAAKGQDEYRVRFKASKLGVGLYFALIKMQYGDKELFGYKHGEQLVFGVENSVNPNIQLSVSSFTHSAPTDIYGGIIYHIFVDRFARGGNYPVKAGAVLVEDWSDGVPEYPAYPGAPLKNNTFYGGTLDGVLKKLDYIQSLGANVIYLSPIFDAASNHKYDTGNYLEVDSMFGGTKALRRLLRECHKRGMYVILDGVFNHTGADSIYFNRYGNYDSVGAYQSTDSEYYSWYDFKSHPDNYTSWWGIEILPRLNPSVGSCREYFLGKGGVVDTYARLGIDGMRLDVVDELPDDFVAELKDVLARNSSPAILYGEVWEDASNKIAYDKRKQYYLGSELDGVMNYPLRKGLIDYIRLKSTDALYYALTDIIKNAPTRISHAQMNLIGTHDTERILTVLGASSAAGKKNSELVSLKMTKEQRSVAAERLKALYTVIATLPGIPAIFYGDEAGLEGYSDPFNRMPYPWGKEDKDLLEHYKAVGRLRRNNSVYKDGAFRLLRLNEDILVFERLTGTYAYITVLNNSSSEIDLSFTAPVKPLLISNGTASFTLSSNAVGVFKAKIGTQLKTKQKMK